MISTWFASKILAVSFKVSPLLRLEVAAEMLITSALNRKAASSNEVRVRVLGSTKKLTSVFPRNAGTFLISRVPTCLKASAVSRTRLISSTDNSRSPSKSLRFQRVVIADVGEHRLPACAPRKEQRDERATQNFGRGRARSFLRAHSFTSQTPSFDSSSPSRSRTLSSGAVGKFFPT